MTTRTRVYFHSGFEPAPAAPGTPRQPYLDRCIMDVLEAKASTPAPKGSTVALVQTDGPVHIEVRPPQDPRPADSYSPILDGEAAYMIGSDWVISVQEAGTLADVPFDLPEVANG
jgi:hypothetical protein